jgi:hypothetical protein
MAHKLRTIEKLLPEVAVEPAPLARAGEPFAEGTTELRPEVRAPQSSGWRSQGIPWLIQRMSSLPKWGLRTVKGKRS